MKINNLFYIAFVFIITSVVACNSNSKKPGDQTTEDISTAENKAEKIYLELVEKYIPIDRDGGACNVGNTRGDAYIRLTKGGLSVSVKYRVITSFSQYTGEFEYSRWVEESGELLDLKLVNDDQNQGYYQISGKWKNNDAGDGHFTLKLFEETKKNTILIQISGSSWSYFDNITLDELKFNEIKSVLRNPNVKINTTNKPAETEQIAEVNNPNAISELCNYGEYISQSNNIDEYLEFTKDENNQLVVQYRTSNKSNTKLGYSGNTIFFMNSSNKKYQIVNIKDDNTGFDLINPDGTIQSFQAIEH